MPNPLNSRGLRIVPAKRQFSIDAALFRRVERQGSLFEEPDSWLVVLASIPDLPDNTFTELIRCSEPALIFDLRLVPRFDFGTLNRERAFELFERVKATYVDATTPLMTGSNKEEVIRLLIQRIALDGVNVRRPVVFLLGRAESSLASQNEILSILGHVGRRLDIVSIPTTE